MDEKGEKDRQTHPVEAKEPLDARDSGDEDAKRDKKKSGDGPPLDATKHERGTSTPSDAGSKEGSSTLEESSSSEDTIPSTLVLVVPGTRRRYNKTREAPTPQAGTTSGAKLTTMADQNPPEKQADKREEGERVDGEMIYTKEDNKMVDSGMW